METSPDEIIEQLCIDQSIAALTQFVQTSKRHRAICQPILERKLAIQKEIGKTLSEVNREGQGFFINEQTDHVVGIFDSDIFSGPRRPYAYFGVDRKSQWWHTAPQDLIGLKQKETLKDYQALEDYVINLFLDGFTYHGYTYP